jgi:predicted Zn-dependent peptidase
VEYYNKYYVPEATVIIVAGNFEEKKIIKEVKDKFEKLKKINKKRKPKTKVIKNGSRVGIKMKPGEQVHLALGFHTFDRHDKRLPAARVLQAILSGGMSSVLFQKMREELGVCYYSYAHSGHGTDAGTFSIHSGVNVNRVEEAIKAILEELKRVKQEGVSEKNLRKAKDYISGHVYMGLESSNSYADYFGFQELFHDDILTTKEWLKEVKKVSVEDIQNLAKEIFKTNNMFLSVVGPVKDKRKLTKILKI